MKPTYRARLVGGPFHWKHVMLAVVPAHIELTRPHPDAPDGPSLLHRALTERYFTVRIQGRRIVMVHEYRVAHISPSSLCGFRAPNRQAAAHIRERAADYAVCEQCQSLLRMDSLCRGGCGDCHGYRLSRSPGVLALAIESMAKSQPQWRQF